MYKGITNIKYNHLNQPTEVDFGTKKTKYTYTATGVKLKTQIFTGTKLENTTDYAGAYVYENDELTYTNIQGGRIVNSPLEGGKGDVAKYQYHLTDHLGNVRVTFGKDANGNAEIIQEDHYYPFGMRMSGSHYSNTELINKYLYNGKELQDQTNYYDYGFRQMDVQLGRWHVVDAMAERYMHESPYAYVGNNPISRTDFMGLTYQYKDPDKEQAINRWLHGGYSGSNWSNFGYDRMGSHRDFASLGYRYSGGSYFDSEGNFVSFSQVMSDLQGHGLVNTIYTSSGGGAGNSGTSETGGFSVATSGAYFVGRSDNTFLQNAKMWLRWLFTGTGVHSSYFRIDLANGPIDYYVTAQGLLRKDYYDSFVEKYKSGEMEGWEEDMYRRMQKRVENRLSQLGKRKRKYNLGKYNTTGNIIIIRDGHVPKQNGAINYYVNGSLVESVLKSHYDPRYSEFTGSNMTIEIIGTDPLQGGVNEVFAIPTYNSIITISILW